MSKKANVSLAIFGIIAIIAIIGMVLLFPLAVAFNPQPEPPGKARRFVSPQEARGFNPQPEPPGKQAQYYTSYAQR